MSINGANNLDELIARAAEARERAYAVYSGFPVGCSIVLTDGSIIMGSSVENASYGLTLCAERAAIAQIISTRDKAGRGIATVVVAGPAGQDCSPCGACRQWLQEHAPDSQIYFPWGGKYIQSTPNELQPFGFELKPAG
jgi:cytidine deaminase